MKLNPCINTNIITNMKVNDFVVLAKKSQSILTSIGMPAEHIYLMGYSDPKVLPSLVFVSPEYNKLDLYHRSQIASSIQQGPLKFNFHIIGTEHLSQARHSLDRDQLYRAIKLYGKQPLIIGGVEYASRADLELLGQAQSELVI